MLLPIKTLPKGYSEAIPSSPEIKGGRVMAKVTLNPMFKDAHGKLIENAP
jgi:hypothetical protein